MHYPSIQYGLKTNLGNLWSFPQFWLLNTRLHSIAVICRLLVRVARQGNKLLTEAPITQLPALQYVAI